MSDFEVRHTHSDVAHCSPGEAGCAKEGSELSVGVEVRNAHQRANFRGARNERI